MAHIRPFFCIPRQAAANICTGMSENGGCRGPPLVVGIFIAHVHVVAFVNVVVWSSGDRAGMFTTPIEACMSFGM
mgnify:CR=1 FL=1